MIDGERESIDQHTVENKNIIRWVYQVNRGEDLFWIVLKEVAKFINSVSFCLKKNFWLFSKIGLSKI